MGTGPLTCRKWKNISWVSLICILYCPSSQANFWQQQEWQQQQQELIGTQNTERGRSLITVTMVPGGWGKTILHFSSFQQMLTPSPPPSPKEKAFDMDKFWVSQTQQPCKWASRDSQERSNNNSLKSRLWTSWSWVLPPCSASRLLVFTIAVAN